MESTAIRLVITSLVVAACLLSGCGEPASELPLSYAKNEVAAAPVDAEPISDSDVDPGAGGKRAAGETGEELYRRLPCAGCHELAARPGQPVFPLEQLSRRYSVDALAAFLATPPLPMPSFDLDLEQRRKLASYLLAAHPWQVKQFGRPIGGRLRFASDPASAESFLAGLVLDPLGACGERCESEFNMRFEFTSEAEGAHFATGWLLGVQTIPEPSTALLVALGLTVLAARRAPRPPGLRRQIGF